MVNGEWSTGVEMKKWEWGRGVEKQAQREKVAEKKEGKTYRRMCIRKRNISFRSSLVSAGATLLGNRIYYFLYRKSLFKLTWNLKKQVCGRKERESNIVFLSTFKLLFRSPSPPTPQVFSRMEFCSSHSRIWRGQSTADAAELKPQKIWFILSLNLVLSFRLGLSKRQRLQVRKIILHS